MKDKNQFILIVFMMFSTLLTAQEHKADLNNPIKIDKEYLSGLDIPPKKLKAHPNKEFYQKRVYKGSELSVFILSGETIRNEFKSFPIEEFVYYVNGRADIETDSQKINFYAKDYLFVPKGFAGSWTNNGGNKLHLELSVISNKRTDSTKISSVKVPFLLDRNKLSGVDFSKNKPEGYEELIYSGVELEIITGSITNDVNKISNSKHEEFIHILSGSLKITPLNGKTETFYNGDFFILPIGFSGTIQSMGNDFSRILKVKQAVD